jgi:hypothetical protein
MTGYFNDHEKKYRRRDENRERRNKETNREE